jgi:hypothetical protein
MNKKRDTIFSNIEAERRATDALRRALTTPYKPQREIVGAKKRITSAGGAGPKIAPKVPEGGEA